MILAVLYHGCVEDARVDYHPFLGMLFAAVLGGTIGIQRQAVHKPAGFRTHLLVAAACATFTAVGWHFQDFRIAANVLTGIGFIGAGTIVRVGFTAQGITTAASVWTAAAIGVACGFGGTFGLALACSMTAIALIALSFSDAVLNRLMRIPKRAVLIVEGAAEKQTAQAVDGALRDCGIAFDLSAIKAVAVSGAAPSTESRYQVAVNDNDRLIEVVRAVSAVPGVTRVQVDETIFSAG